MREAGEIVFIVTDLRQYSYCPRILYYTYCLPLVRPTTYKMEAGVEAHRREVQREGRRSLKPYGLSEGERFTQVEVESCRLGLRGKLDLLIKSEQNGDARLIPVEYKYSRREVGPHVRIQLTAYAMMLEEAHDTTIERGLVYLIPRREVVEVPITAPLRRKLLAQLEEMREIVLNERMPDPPKSRRQCVNCEFRRFCNDVL